MFKDYQSLRILRDKTVLDWKESNFNEVVTAQRAGSGNVRLSEWKGFTLLTRKDLCPRVGE